MRNETDHCWRTTAVWHSVLTQYLLSLPSLLVVPHDHASTCPNYLSYHSCYWSTLPHPGLLIDCCRVLQMRGWKTVVIVSLLIGPSVMFLGPSLALCLVAVVHSVQKTALYPSWIRSFAVSFAVPSASWYRQSCEQSWSSFPDRNWHIHSTPSCPLLPMPDSVLTVPWVWHASFLSVLPSVLESMAFCQFRLVV